MARIVVEGEVEVVFADRGLGRVRMKDADGDGVLAGGAVDGEDEVVAEANVGVGFAVAEGGEGVHENRGGARSAVVGMRYDVVGASTSRSGYAERAWRGRRIRRR